MTSPWTYRPQTSQSNHILTQKPRGFKPNLGYSLEPLELGLSLNSKIHAYFFTFETPFISQNI